MVLNSVCCLNSLAFLHPSALLLDSHCLILLIRPGSREGSNCEYTQNVKVLSSTKAGQMSLHKKKKNKIHKDGGDGIITYGNRALKAGLPREVLSHQRQNTEQT